jgi:hypothetical protein
MKLRTLGAAVLRRWYVAIAGLLAVGGLSYLLYGMIPVDYKTIGSVVLLPSTKTVGAGGNPYLYLGGLGQAMDVLTRRVTAIDVTDRLTAPYPKSSYTALPDVTAGSSIMVVTVKARTATESTALLNRILAETPRQLSVMQDELKVPDDSRIASMQVAQPTDPILDGKPRLQAVAGAGAAGVLLVLLMTATVDGVLLRRAWRCADAADGMAPTPEDAEADDAPAPARVLLIGAEEKGDAEIAVAEPEDTARSGLVSLRPRRAAVGDRS